MFIYVLNLLKRLLDFEKNENLQKITNPMSVDY